MFVVWPLLVPFSEYGTNHFPGFDRTEAQVFLVEPAQDRKVECHKLSDLGNMELGKTLFRKDRK